MECPNCNSPVKFFDLIKINHKNPYNCPVCFKLSGFNHSKIFINLIAGIAGLAGVLLFYSIDKYGWKYGLYIIFIMIISFIIIFLKYAKLELINTKNES